MTIGEAQKMLVAIHKHCFECSGCSRERVNKCEVKSCALYPYRQPVEFNGNEKEERQISLFDNQEA